MANVGSTEMLSDNLTGWDVARTTTDKLEEILNGYSDGWTVWSVTHTGGRDWVILAKCEWETLVDKCNDYGEPVEDWDGS